jgi:hypothetical protein
MFFKIISLLPGLTISFTVLIGQPTDLTKSNTKADYLKKSKTQKIIAFSLLGGGTIAWLAGASKNMNQEDNIDGGGEATMIIGGTAALASIPLFIISSKNKKKAMSMSFKNQILPQLQHNGFVHRATPSLTIKISL